MPSTRHGESTGLQQHTQQPHSSSISSSGGSSGASFSSGNDGVRSSCYACSFHGCLYDNSGDDGDRNFQSCFGFCHEAFVTDVGEDVVEGGIRQSSRGITLAAKPISSMVDLVASSGITVAGGRATAKPSASIGTTSAGGLVKARALAAAGGLSSACFVAEYLLNHECTSYDGEHPKTNVMHVTLRVLLNAWCGCSSWQSQPRNASPESMALLLANGSRRGTSVASIKAHVSPLRHYGFCHFCCGIKRGYRRCIQARRVALMTASLVDQASAGMVPEAL